MGRLWLVDRRTDIQDVLHDEIVDDHWTGFDIPHTHNQSSHKMILAVSCKIGKDKEHGNGIYYTGRLHF